MFKNKILLITGGTGSFGNAIMKHFINSDIKEVRIFSRDEKKQDDMRKKYNSDKLKFYIGDVRDMNSLDVATSNVDYIFHAAALKQVPSCEFFPMEAIKTNILGTENLLNSAINNNVQKIVILSTDKAVYPINSMGLSKSLMEKVMVAKSRNNLHVMMCGTRYGNVMGSRGSVIPLFINQIKHNKPITITNPNMTRFMMSLDDAVNLVLFAFKNGKSGEIFVQKSPAATIEVLANSLKQLYDSSVPIKIIGIRHGEKMYETLVSSEEMLKAEDLGEYFRIKSDNRSLDYEKYIDKGLPKENISEEYNSHNTERLNIEQTKKLLMSLNFIKKDFK